MGFKLFIMFAVVTTLDGLVLPAFLGFKESFLSILILVLTVLYLGCTKQNVVYGSIFSVVLESFKGLTVGTLAIPFLLTMALIYFIQRFVDIKYMPNQVVGLGKLTILAPVSTFLVYALLFFAGRGAINTEYFNAVIIFVTASEALMTVFIFNSIFNEKHGHV